MWAASHSPTLQRNFAAGHLRGIECVGKAKPLAAVGGNRVRAAREAAVFGFQLIPDGKTAAARAASGNLQGPPGGERGSPLARRIFDPHVRFLRITSAV